MLNTGRSLYQFNAGTMTMRTKNRDLRPTDRRERNGSVVDPKALDVRPPKQRRSRAAWRRVLDAGVAILADGGYEAFTIAAVCDRAGAAPPAIYVHQGAMATGRVRLD